MDDQRAIGRACSADLKRRRGRGLRLSALLACLLLGAWQSPGVAAWPGEQRTVTPRGALGADERAVIELFERTRDSVVYITTSELVQDLWTRNVFAVPRGTGSGFVWDEAGHVVTNFHVIQGAARATVRLADGRDYPATWWGQVRRTTSPCSG